MTTHIQIGLAADLNIPDNLDNSRSGYAKTVTGVLVPADKQDRVSAVHQCRIVLHVIYQRFFLLRAYFYRRAIHQRPTIHPE